MLRLIGGQVDLPEVVDSIIKRECLIVASPDGIVCHPSGGVIPSGGVKPSGKPSGGGIGGIAVGIGNKWGRVIPENLFGS